MADPASNLPPPVSTDDQVTGLSPPLAIISVVILIVTWYFTSSSSKKTSKRPPPLPPGPRGWPIVGYVPYLAGDKPLHRLLADLAAQYGPIFKIWFANQMFAVVSSPDMAREVLQRGGENEPIFSTRGFPAAAGSLTYGGKLLLSKPMDLDWKSTRKLLVRETINNRSLDICYPLRRREVLRSLTEISNGRNIPVGVYEIANKIVSDATLSMLWGREGDRFYFDEWREVSQEVTEMNSRPNVSDVFPLLARFDLQGIQRMTAELAERLDRVLSSVIARRVENNKKKEKEERFKDMLQILLEIKADYSNDPAAGRSHPLATMNHFKALLVDIAFGGIENMSNVIEWALSELLMNERAMNKVKQELDDIVGRDSVVEDHHLKNLDYLEAILKETCRLHLNIFPRLSTKPCTLGGYSIPEGSTVIVNSWAIHRDPKHWDEPSEFRPERFLNTENEGRPFDLMGNNSSFRFIAFGSGQRVCAGVNMTGKLLMYVLASLLHSFDWKLPEGVEEVEMSDCFKVFIKKKKPLVAVPTLRLASQDLFTA